MEGGSSDQLRYPRWISVNFRQLSEESLRTYMARYRVSIPKDVSKSGLGALVARHFDTVNADEEAILARFFERLEGKSLQYTKPETNLSQVVD